MNKHFKFAAALCLLSAMPALAAAQSSAERSGICPTLVQVTKIAAAQAKARADRDIFETSIFKALMSSTKNETRKSLYTETFSSAQTALQETGGNPDRAGAAAELTCMKA